MAGHEDSANVDGNQELSLTPQMPQRTLAHIKNKQRRQELFRKMQIEKRKEKIKERKKKKKEDEMAGDKARPKQVPKTIENMRVFDETMVNPEDQEVAYDEANDEMAPYFSRQTSPKVVITTSDKAAWTTRRLCKELSSCIPNSEVHHRRHLAIKKIIKRAIEKDFTDLIIINDNRGKPNGMIISHLPEGPTTHFKMSNVKLREDIKRCGATTNHCPELILNNFNTRLGHSVGRQIASLFPHDPNFVGRRVVTFHNQRDYIFFRHHRYVFKDNKKVGLKELGPRFTLKLRSLQKGTFDSKYGEYEWVHKRHEMDSSRRKFFL